MRSVHRPSRPLLPRLLRTASVRLAALYLALFVVSAVILGGGVYLAARSALNQQMVARIEAENDFLHEEFRGGGMAALRGLLEHRGRGAAALDYLLQSADGTKLAGDIPADPALRPGWLTLRVPESPDDPTETERVRALVTALDDGGLLAVGDDLARIEDVQAAIISALLWTIGGAALLGIGGGLLLSRAFLARVDAIARTAEAIIGGDLARRVPERGTNDDLDRLARTLNRMLDRIAALMASLRQVTADVAHDLRTPLTRLHQRLEDARYHAVTLGQYEAAVAGAMQEAEALLDIFSALLRIAQVEGASPQSGFRRVDLSSAAEAVSDAYRPDVEQASHTLGASVAPGVHVMGDQELLTQALANLVENALRHTPAGTHIALALRRDADGAVSLSVRDDGPGVATEDLPRLTARFYRAEHSRTTPGNGLGLSLVAAVAELHGAALLLRDASPGLHAELRFPPGTAGTA